jgi:hypothetical protein
MVKINDELQRPFVFIIGLGLVGLFVFLPGYILDAKYDANCFYNIADNYCENSNQTLYYLNANELTYFKCQEKYFDPRIAHYTKVHNYNFLKEEIDKCTIRKSRWDLWFNNN